MKRVLILTYYWPPAGGPGVQRWLKFVKYFGAFGWKPYVLTVDKGTYSATDTELEKEVPQGLPVYKTRSRDPFSWYNMLKGKKDGSVSVALINIDKDRSLIDRISMYIRSNFFIPDARKGWVPYATAAARRIIREENIDLLVTTGPPHSTHLAGLAIRKGFNIPWLADLRDPWTTVYYNDMLPRTARTKKKDKRLEDLVLGHADAVTVVSPGMKKEFAGRNRNVNVVMNGFDMDDMEGIANDKKDDGKFRITYTGNFKPNQHIPEIWSAVCELIEDHPGLEDDLRICFVGNLDASVPEYFSDLGRSDILEPVSYVPHAEATGIMQQASMLLFVVPRAANNLLIITGKLFEYLASGTPILPIGPVNGDAAAILEDAGREIMLGYDDKKGVKESILKHYHDWKNGNLQRHEPGMLEKYSRRATAKAMADIMNDLIQ